MAINAAYDTIFNETLGDAFEALKTGANDSVTVRRLQKRSDELASGDASSAWDLRAYACAVTDAFDAADEHFARALRLSPNNPNLVVRWLAMLCVTGQVTKVKATFLALRGQLEGHASALRATASLLGYVGLLLDAYQVREKLASSGGLLRSDAPEADVAMASVEVRQAGANVEGDGADDPLPCSSYTATAEDAKVLQTAYGLADDAWSEPIGCAIRYLRQRRLKVIAVKSSFVPNESGPATLHFQVLIHAPPSVSSAAEWDFLDDLVAADYPAASSWAVSVAFVPTLAEVRNGDIA
ncbi:hypothetical protein PDM28_12985 [Stenotrophomonas aracearum]|jgi:hypothetical protein|uniref:Tetratricopeptide repeat protein n=1 Tax=Stenotrophomonas aracearum TaxID=3003272 RepID=A0ABY9Y9P9_9GAMM|nr:hypothetical protein [Stenotrophomonas sp. A5588]WNH47599.1 hypothetical protein PDM28_12985 [Stenotrophomonas sp. A5588]